MDKQSLDTLEKYEKFRGLDGNHREIRELPNGRQQIIYRNQKVIHGPILREFPICSQTKSNQTFEERKQALKNKLMKLQKERKTK